MLSCRQQFHYERIDRILQKMKSVKVLPIILDLDWETCMERVEERRIKQGSRLIDFEPHRSKHQFLVDFTCPNLNRIDARQPHEFVFEKISTLLKMHGLEGKFDSSSPAL